MAELVDSIRVKRDKTEYYLNSFKKEMRGKVERTQKDVNGLRGALENQGEYDAQVVRDVEEINKRLMADRTDWVREIVALRQATFVDLRGRVLALENFLGRYAQANAVPSPYQPGSSIPQDSAASQQISSATVHQVLSALMTTPSRPVACAA